MLIVLTEKPFLRKRRMVTVNALHILLVRDRRHATYVRLRGRLLPLRVVETAAVIKVMANGQYK